MEPVEVFARWDAQGRPYPQHFSLAGRRYLVESTGRRWRDETGEHLLCMLAGGRVVELVHQFGEDRWLLNERSAPPAKA